MLSKSVNFKFHCLSPTEKGIVRSLRQMEFTTEDWRSQSGLRVFFQRSWRLTSHEERDCCFQYTVIPTKCWLFCYAIFRIYWCYLFLKTSYVTVVTLNKAVGRAHEGHSNNIKSESQIDTLPTSVTQCISQRQLQKKVNIDCPAPYKINRRASNARLECFCFCYQRSKIFIEICTILHDTN